jgi:hypothetical protein
MASIASFTYQDAVDHVVDYLGGITAGVTIRDARRAVQGAYREFAAIRRWAYYATVGRLNTVASYSTGTVTYDHCVTPEHEALTRAGWKTYDQLNVGDEILAYDHDAEMCSWQAIEKLHVSDYEGKILNVVRKGRSVLRCTPNHRVPVFERAGGSKSRKSNRPSKRFVKASELTTEMTTPLAAPLENETAGPLDSRTAALLGWAVTDGHGLYTNSGPWGQVGISQSRKVNAHKCAEIEYLVGRSSWCPGEKAVYGLKPDDRRLLKSLVKTRADVSQVFLAFGVHEAEAAVRAMIQAEASTNTSNNQKVFSQWNHNKPIAEAFQIACLLSGKATNISERTYAGAGTRYQSAVRHSKGIKLAKLSAWEDYKGVVWCPQVRTGAWVVRCNGAVMITGNSGGTNERQLTLASGTWPTWTAYGIVTIASIRYEVAERKSATVLTLSVNSNPGADVAAGTSYMIARDSYPMPADFLAADRLTAWRSSVAMPSYVMPAQWLSMQQILTSAGVPRAYTFTGSSDFQGAMAVRFSPSPDAIYPFEFVYQRRGRPLQYDNYSTGKVSGTGDATTLTGEGTAWTSAYNGAIIRIGATTTVPKGLIDADAFLMERTIMSVNSATSITLDVVLESTVASQGYIISDGVDIEEGAMMNGFLRCIEKQETITRRMKNAQDANANYMMALTLAMEADQRNMTQQYAGGGGTGGSSLRDFPITDVGQIA